MTTEQTLTGEALLERYKTTVHPEAEASIGGTWRHIEKVCTDNGDDTNPVFLDLTDPAERRLLTYTDDILVRGVAD